jgi:hypothetical protein
VANELYILLIISDEISFVMRSGCHTFLSFCLELAKLLHVATFLDTAAMYHVYVVVVLKMTSAGATSKLSF